ncbi:VPLPA-CTERM sorting domain-containing protein [Rhodovulum sp. DZ06]|uniref:VPLPA-CTERM sorting domain-containing protein n=1 Tax=Rhodovulum sp. DZ06 TaxID=3425126 RepID=UPI003D33FF73
MKHAFAGAALAALAAATPAAAVPYAWTDWQSQTATGGVTVEGEITTDTATVGVTYNNPVGIGFAQLSGGTDYWQNNTGGRNDAISPYTSLANPLLTNPSPGVDNSPTGTDIIALRYAGLQTLTFTEAVANPVFAFVSLNGNGYAFDQDFEILSCTRCNIDGAGNDSDGYYGGSNSTQKTVVETSPGVFEYRLISNDGEPHGTIRFIGSFSTLTWRSLSNEYWNGFTVGIQGTAEEVFSDVPLPAGAGLLVAGLAGFGLVRRRG